MKIKDVVSFLPKKVIFQNITKDSTVPAQVCKSVNAALKVDNSEKNIYLKNLRFDEVSLN